MNDINIITDLIAEVSKGFIGKKDIVEDSLLAIFSDLHILIEDISGVGKTTLAKCIGKATGLSVGRIQFTPDLLPGDITGISIWDPINRDFKLKKGSVFNEFIIADEINRSSPRTQSALLEAMEEKTVTIDGTSYILPEPFFVFATKNPSYYLGTFDLPESQIDRFGVFLKPGYPKLEDEINIIQTFKNIKPTQNINQITCKEKIIEIQNRVSNITIPESIMKYIVDIGNKTRTDTSIKFGISTRGLQHLVKFSQAKAFISNRDFLIPEDIMYSVKRVFPHKLILSSEAIINNISSEDIIKKILDSISIPIGIK
ncbi:MAG: MoxR family ATPase [Spirochaetales bacterium]|nr:MoxR family ATPase [Spirochaetales bacterium]